MTETPNVSTINLLEVNTRAEQARHIIAGFSRGAPALADLWDQVYDSLSDIPYLATELTNLRERLTAIRLERANLAAASRIAIVAFRNGEPDPLFYLQDELHAQGFGAGRESA